MPEPKNCQEYGCINPYYQAVWVNEYPRWKRHYCCAQCAEYHLKNGGSSDRPEQPPMRPKKEPKTNRKSPKKESPVKNPPPLTIKSTPTALLCKAQGCSRPAKQDGFCAAHLKQARAQGLIALPTVTPAADPVLAEPEVRLADDLNLEMSAEVAALRQEVADKSAVIEALRQELGEARQRTGSVVLLQELERERDRLQVELEVAKKALGFIQGALEIPSGAGAPVLALQRVLDIQDELAVKRELLTERVNEFAEVVRELDAAKVEVEQLRVDMGAWKQSLDAYRIWGEEMRKMLGVAASFDELDGLSVCLARVGALLSAEVRLTPDDLERRQCLLDEAEHLEEAVSFGESATFAGVELPVEELAPVIRARIERLRNDALTVRGVA